MIILCKKKHSVLSLTILIILIIFGLILNYFMEDRRTIAFIFGALVCLMFVLGFENISFKGRFSNRDSLLWFYYLLLSILIATLFLVLIGYLANVLNIYVSYTIRSSFSTIFIFSILLYFAFKFIQLLYKRFQDFNQPGYYLIGILPIVSWFIGVKIYKSGKKFLGILVFLNLAVALIYILFVSGDSCSNYFGIKPKHCRNFLSEYKKIMKAKSLSQIDKNLLFQELQKKFEELESLDSKKFIEKEVARLLKKEKVFIKVNTEINENRTNYFEKIVKNKMKKNYINNCHFGQLVIPILKN